MIYNKKNQEIINELKNEDSLSNVKQNKNSNYRECTGEQIVIDEKYMLQKYSNMNLPTEELLIEEENNQVMSVPAITKKKKQPNSSFTNKMLKTGNKELSSGT